MSVFIQERDAAYLSGRCMGCDERTKYLPTSERYAALCRHPECRRYYNSLFYEGVQRERRAVVKRSKLGANVPGERST